MSRFISRRRASLSTAHIRGCDLERPFTPLIMTVMTAHLVSIIGREVALVIACILGLISYRRLLTNTTGVRMCEMVWRTNLDLHCTPLILLPALVLTLLAAFMMEPVGWFLW